MLDLVWFPGSLAPQAPRNDRQMTAKAVKFPFNFNP